MAADRTGPPRATPREPGGASRPLRADARRNRERLLEVAAHAFADEGPEVTLERIAKEAGVGIGTLYRHFPTREALIEAAHRSEVTRLCEAVPGLLRDHPADVALRAWMDQVLAYLTAKHGMAAALRAVIASDQAPAQDVASAQDQDSLQDQASAPDQAPAEHPFRKSRATLLDAIGTVLRAGVSEGVLRADVEPYDILAGLSGVSLVAEVLEGGPARQLDLQLDGLRPRPGDA
ncbi:TetR family transcriptional regulator [Streptomyces sp. DW26H14]|uniref:TetR family transcriptional regulator n=1 Tax=Streptomyces sp. DW26H14 TaxID=3435395 RepID=UPI00403E31FF